jgi:hypothetical protein
VGTERRSRRWVGEFAALAALLLLTRAGDGLLTHAITPDLSREANPVSSVLGLGWAGLIAAAAVVLAGVMWLNYVSLTRPCDNFPAEFGADWPAFRADYFDVRGTALFARHPGRVFAYVCGYAFPRAIIAWSVLLLTHNWLVLTDAVWYRPIRAYRLSFAIYLALPAFCFILVHQLQRQDYRRYAASRAAGPGAAPDPARAGGPESS